MSSVALYDHPLLTTHNTGLMHPERPARVRALREMIEQSGLSPRLTHLVSEPASLAAVERVHAASLITHLRELAALPAPQQIDADTVMGQTSFEAALVSAGGALSAAHAVLRGEHDAALVVARPPGHHATAMQAMGFCLLNNVAVAARGVIDSGAAKRVAVIDWDVHHGNGTQDIFYDDGQVLYISLHQYPFYPGTGAADEVGSGAGAGATLNVPMPSGQTDGVYQRAFHELVLPKLTWFEPDVILISAGFDAHGDDPIGQMKLTPAAFASMTQATADWCRAHHRPGPVLVLEGGYSLPGLAESVQASLETLLGTPAPALSDVELPLFAELRARHNL